MILPDFLEELNQGGEKAFGDNAQSMIDSLLYANCPQLNPMTEISQHSPKGSNDIEHYFTYAVFQFLQ